jgi:hypothetical protein
MTNLGHPPRELAVGEGVDPHRRRLTHLDETQLRLGHVDPDPELVFLEQRGGGLVRGEEIAGAKIETLDARLGRGCDGELVVLALDIGEGLLGLRELRLRGVDVLAPAATLELGERLAGGRLGDLGAVVVALPVASELRPGMAAFVTLSNAAPEPE